jgi:uncharacterized Fe-S cluster protein YjdI
VKNIRYFTHGTETIEWNPEDCLHSGKCIKNIPYIIEKPGIYSINVSEKQFEAIQNQAEYCPSKALKIIGPTK